MRLIDADSLWEAVNYAEWYDNADRDIALDLIDEELTVGEKAGGTAVNAEDVAPVKHGKWVKNIRGGSMVCSECRTGIIDGTLILSECNRASDEREFCSAFFDVARYCPCCGAKMPIMRGY